MRFADACHLNTVILSILSTTRMFKKQMPANCRFLPPVSDPTVSTSYTLSVAVACDDEVDKATKSFWDKVDTKPLIADGVNMYQSTECTRGLGEQNGCCGLVTPIC